jgi:hypothetical protein
LKIIATLPVKNDFWFVEKSILTLAAWADHVFVADENSDDGSHELYKKLGYLKNVTFILNRPKVSFNTPDLRNYLLDLARSFDGNNMIFELHADEVMSAEILKPENKEKLLDRAIGGNAFLLPWITMWDKPILYRNDASVWANNFCWFGYCDDRRVKFEGPVFHGSRAPEKFLNNKVNVDWLSVLHYQFINKSNERSKQALYQIYERNHFPNKSIEHINKIYAVAFDTRDIKLSQIDSVHIHPWISQGIPLLEEYTNESLNWRDLEALRNFKKYGIKYYERINIWYINWEAKRQEAIALGYIDEMPNTTVLDERNISTKLAHWWVTNTQLYAFWRWDFLKLLVMKVVQKITG